ncbi:class I SAM-dependent methyltransferase [Deinococcus pimensis]|uniref:class I SAM-dependent methyltransferase n=1 Tax=Deinococcus pimensis TaxID=309888 RepID=UPI0005EB533A|nr:methyltransferase domain-containing protein [Deinococcus pimensis]
MTAPLNVIIGAGDQAWDGWTPTHREELDLTDPASFERWFGERRADAFLCEHVWEHLTLEQGAEAARLCFEYLRPGGWLRCAVPDANFPDEAYQRTVRIGGPGPADHPAADHRVVYDARTLRRVFESAGFEVELLEYCDDGGRFHYHGWDVTTGPIYRSLLLDHRNRDGRLGFVSLIVEARRPASAGPPRGPSRAS